jgi:hypothetical protein
MTTKKTGGSAFPIYQPDMNVGDDAGPGMTLRDYFAGQALSRLTLSSKWTSLDNSVREMATVAYVLADAMLAEREEGE